jgi:hypothetical protein
MGGESIHIVLSRTRVLQNLLSGIGSHYKERQASYGKKLRLSEAKIPISIAKTFGMLSKRVSILNGRYVSRAILYWYDEIANKMLQLGVQIFDEDQQLAFGFDVLDDTKFIPEEIVPVTPLGVMTLNANPQNYFAETEQVGVSQVNQ